MSKKISALSAGSLVKLNENGVAKKYIMLGYNHYGKAEVTLLRKDAVGNRAYNACQSGYNVYNGNSLDSFVTSSISSASTRSFGRAWSMCLSPRPTAM